MQSATPFHTLHGIEETAESRKDVAIDKAREISALSRFFFLGGVGGGAEGAGKTREKTFKYNESPMSENPLLSRRISCSKSLHLKF